MTLNILQMRDIDKGFNGVPVLKHVNLEVRRGEVHAICGENGAGKSTLMKVLSGVYPHGQYEGEIIWEGKEVSFSSIKDSEALGIGIIHQELALVPYLSVAENLFLGIDKPKRHGLIDWHEINHRAEEVLAKVGLDENVTTPVGQLGVGKQQLIEIGKALSKDVKLLILDEPTAALNDNDSAQLLELVRQLKESGVSIVIISHKLNEIAAIADRTTILRDGQTIETLDMSDPASTQNKIISLMVGRELSQRYPVRESHIGEELFRVEDWTVYHPTQEGRLVIKDASFNVRHGEVVGIAGLMGAGRTELAMSLFGRSYGRNISGRIYKEGKEIRIKSVSDAIKNGIAYATEDRKQYGLNLIDDIRHNIATAGLFKLSRHGMVNGNEELAVASDYKDRMNIRSQSVMQLAGSLSGGNQQKVVLSKWLYTDADVLILDEPTRGIDVGAKYEIYTLINKMVEAGKAVIVISSELEEILGISDRVYTLAYGRITGELPIAEANQENLMELMTIEPSRENDK
ncbi:multiple monosaccharide ABC transporter ATP-binding protein [Schaalia hyovaginalis]|uniref:multiple monosaccharide ABC transporter ATP-binding protein n=1 Tax=Schaalia hyovaginalis TaxID=29316 RepID=UPI0012B2D8DE|nr:multiple monosaccharide ABC transporter ATP-binding protein [Schaalia hyovaginalis]MCF2710747.1 ATP-binding cassette domain-containing protein [Schaalia hyovaginalis]MCI7513358.1 ATP-binding cassette domain-containing protein [Schaalia hyovaginalis]MDY3666285.1 multiple monosaccharide ABC transporter ATP-binding protein [Schaalia hyovaginalis]MDY5600523.1 multiple monosaccharide ABC transporter ATP-binding protein [Schaalia hyovaginalis]MST64195.1 ATP-binding cassette domain-containing prot